jgi:hypothetical protein
MEKDNEEWRRQFEKLYPKALERAQNRWELIGPKELTPKQRRQQGSEWLAGWLGVLARDLQTPVMELIEQGRPIAILRKSEELPVESEDLQRRLMDVISMASPVDVVNWKMVCERLKEYLEED